MLGKHRGLGTTADSNLTLIPGAPKLRLPLWLLPASTPMTDASAITNSVLGIQRAKRSSVDVSVSVPLP